MTTQMKSRYCNEEGSIERHGMTIHEPKLTIEWEIDEKMCVVTKAQLPYHPTTLQLTPISWSGKIHKKALFEMEENPYFCIEQPNSTIIPALPNPDNRAPGKFMTILWNPDGQSISIKKNPIIGYVKESDSIKNSKQTKKKISRKLLKYTKKNYHLCLRNQHLHFITTSIQSQR